MSNETRTTNWMLTGMPRSFSTRASSRESGLLRLLRRTSAGAFGPTEEFENNAINSKVVLGNSERDDLGQARREFSFVLHGHEIAKGLLFSEYADIVRYLQENGVNTQYQIPFAFESVFWLTREINLCGYNTVLTRDRLRNLGVNIGVVKGVTQLFIRYASPPDSINMVETKKLIDNHGWFTTVVEM